MPRSRLNQDPEDAVAGSPSYDRDHHGNEGSPDSRENQTVELIPKALIVGFLRGQLVNLGQVSGIAQVPGTSLISRDIINRIWGEVVKEYPSYQSLQFDPSGRGGVFVGQSGPDDLVLIQPTLLQVRTPVDEYGVDRTASKVAFILRTILHQYSGPPSVNLGIKIIAWAPSPNPSKDATAFIRNELVKQDEAFTTMAGSMDLQIGLKVITTQDASLTRTLLIEPLQVDKTTLYLDLDSQVPGLVDEARLEDNIKKAYEFLDKPVRHMLENATAT